VFEIGPLGPCCKEAYKSLLKSLNFVSYWAYPIGLLEGNEPVLLASINWSWVYVNTPLGVPSVAVLLYLYGLVFGVVCEPSNTLIPFSRSLKIEILPLKKFVVYCLLTPKLPTILLRFKTGAVAITDSGLNKREDWLLVSFPSISKFCSLESADVKLGDAGLGSATYRYFLTLLLLTPVLK